MLQRSHTVILAFALVFTLGMALAVALLCIPSTEDELFSEETQGNVFLQSTPLSDGTSLLPDYVEGELSNGLAFRSLGKGECELFGIGSCQDGCVVIPEYAPSGERVVGIAPQALYGVESLTALQIPASIRTIGALALSACPNLMYISVSDSNRYFCDREGVLYSSDGTVLLLYPPRRAGNRVIIEAETVEICDMAFYGCAYLSSITYRGSAEMWEQIAVGAKNYSLIAASKEFAE